MPNTPKRGDEESARLRFIGLQLAQVREKAGISQEEAGAHVGNSQSWMGRVEAGRLGISAIDLKVLADLYGYPVDWFVDPHYSGKTMIQPRSRADWEFMFPDDEERARTHAEIDAIIRRARQGSGDGTAAEGPR